MIWVGEKKAKKGWQEMWNLLLLSTNTHTYTYTLWRYEARKATTTVHWCVHLSLMLLMMMLLPLLPHN